MGRRRQSAAGLAALALVLSIAYGEAGSAVGQDLTAASVPGNDSVTWLDGADDGDLASLSILRGRLDLAEATDEDTGSLTWRWASDQEGTILRAPSGTARLHVSSCVTTHILTVTVTDTAGQTDSASVTVTVAQAC